MDRITIELPLPTEAMSGHAKGHWRAKAQTTRRMREYACLAAIGALGRHEPPQWERATISFAFYLANRRRRDVLNLVHGCKPSIDGFVDAKVIVDDDWKNLTVGRIECAVDAENPRVVIELAAAIRAKANKEPA